VKVNDLVRIGVLAVQGNFREHGAMLRRLGVDSIEVRRAEQLEGLDGLVVPGGESTAISRLMRVGGLEEPIREFPGALFGTCAGMILFARDHLGLLDVEVERNAYGRQVASFEADVTIEGENEPLPGVFIRAPRIVETGAAVEVLGRLAGEAVLVREGRILAASFHPELTHDTRVHERFLQVVGERREVSVVGP
jgi:5'-phosphate synthase pdxT subunit